MNLTQFTSTWLGRAADFDGAYGAQCVDLFNFYNRDVVGGGRIPVSYAYQLYDTYDSNAYTRVSAATPAQRGDVAIWASNLPYSGGAGHVAIVLSDQGGTLTVLQQNANNRQYVTQDAGQSKGYLRGYLRPKSLPPETVIRGSIDSATSPAPGLLALGGWAFDEDAKTTAIGVHVYVGGPAGSASAQGFDLGAADKLRVDVGNAYPGVGNYHGYERTLEVARFGTQPVYVYAINAPGTPGGNVLLGSRTVHIAQPNPFGSLDSAESPRPGWLRVSGWAADPSAPTSPLAVHVYGGDAMLRSIDANQSRPDVGTAFPGYGDLHGYDASFPAPPGTYDVCAYGINIGVGNTNSQLACRRVTVATDATAPQTSITAAPAASGTATDVSISFDADEPGVTFECQWGTGPWTACSSPARQSMSAGTHSFSVRATDPAGNIDASPASVTFSITTVGAPPPTVATPQPEANPLSVRVRTVRKRSALVIDVNPDSIADNYAFQVQRKTAKGWRTVKAMSTRGPTDSRGVDLPRGTYRVFVPAQHGAMGIRSTSVKLRR